MKVDHLVYGVRDLDAAVERFSTEHGLDAVERGRHPDFGTANAVLPVGDDQYVELLAVAEGAPPDHPVVGALTRLLADGDRWVGMCLRPPDLDGQARRLQLAPREASRIGADGTTVHWRLLGMEAALGPDRLPYFIDWGAGGSHLPAHHPGGGFAWVEHGGDAEQLRGWIGPGVDDLPLRLTGGAPGVQAAAVAAATTSWSSADQRVSGRRRAPPAG